jgi:hypothetical protein
MYLDDKFGSEVGINQSGFTQICYGILFRIRPGRYFLTRPDMSRTRQKMLWHLVKCMKLSVYYKNNR